MTPYKGHGGLTVPYLEPNLYIAKHAEPADYHRTVGLVKEQVPVNMSWMVRVVQTCLLAEV